jgi:hypothetical protein
MSLDVYFNGTAWPDRTGSLNRYGTFWSACKPPFEEQITSPPTTGRWLWLDAAQISDKANGADVGSWGDFSGNGRYPRVGEGAGTPTYRTGGKNNVPFIRFLNDVKQSLIWGGGFQDLIQGGAGALTEIECWAVARFNIEEGTSNIHSGLLDFTGISAGIGQTILNGAGGTITDVAFVDTVQTYVRGSTNLVTDWFVYRVKISPQADPTPNIYYNVWFNNQQLGSQVNLTNSSLAGTMRLGQGKDGNTLFLGSISELLIYNDNHSDADLGTMKSYLNYKYGFSLT